VAGNSNKVIARMCQITEATVKVHLKAILRKTEVVNRTQAAVWAINNMPMDKLASEVEKARENGHAQLDGAKKSWLPAAIMSAAPMALLLTLAYRLARTVAENVSLSAMI
jgi:two-component system nitrate/nitrite response regulator NarL